MRRLAPHTIALVFALSFTGTYLDGAEVAEETMKPGDKMKVTIGPASVKDDDGNEITKVKAGSELTVASVDGGRVKVSILSEGKEITGWVERFRLKPAFPLTAPKAIKKSSEPSPKPGDEGSKANPTDQPSRAFAQIEKALNLLGQISEVSAKSRNMKSAIGLKRKADEVAKNGVAAAMKALVVKARELDPNAELTLECTGNPDLDKLKALLGPQDETEEDRSGRVPVTWYKYGWLSFGVSRTKVRHVRADCASVPADWPPGP